MVVGLLISGYLIIPSVAITERSSLEEVQAAELSVLAADVLSLVAGILAIFVVRRLTERQTERASRLGAARPPGNPLWRPA